MMDERIAPINNPKFNDFIKDVLHPLYYEWFTHTQNAITLMHSNASPIQYAFSSHTE